MDFIQSKEYQSLSKYPQLILKTALEVVSKFLVLLNNVAYYGDNPELDEALLAVYNIMKSYFNYLLSEKELDMSKDQLNDLTSHFERENKLQGLPDFSNIETSLSAWDWKIAYNIDESVEMWILEVLNPQMN